MATYKQIEANIRAQHGHTIKTCWIAHVKELNGLNLRSAHNRESLHRRVHPCPPQMRVLIEAAMRQLGMLSEK